METSYCSQGTKISPQLGEPRLLRIAPGVFGGLEEQLRWGVEEKLVHMLVNIRGSLTKEV